MAKVALQQFEPTNFNYCPANFVDQGTPERIQKEQWRRETALTRTTQFVSNNLSRGTKVVRENVRDFFSSSQAQVP